MNSFSNPRKLLRQVMKITEDLVDAEASSVMLYDPEANDLYFEVALGSKARRIINKRLSLDEGIAGYVARTGKIVNTGNVRKNPNFYSAIDSTSGFTTRSLLALPIRRKNRMVGVIEAINKRGAKRFSPADVALMKIVASQAAMAIENTRLYDRKLKEFADKKTNWLKNAFQTYTPPEMVEELLNNHKKLKLGGVRKEVSVLFSDIKGFSEIAEKCRPGQLTALINDYLNPMAGIILLHQGTIDKYIGDAIMAFFGAPLPAANHPQLAVGTALEMLRALRTLNRTWMKDGRPRIEIGVGINTGRVSVGNVGSEKRLNYTVMGDNVNVAERLEKLTRVYGNNILVTEATWQKVRDTFCCREIAVTPLKGRAEPVRIYEPLAPWQHIRPEVKTLAASFEAGLAFYREKKFDRAEACFRALLERYPDDGPSRHYLDRLTGPGGPEPDPAAPGG